MKAPAAENPAFLGLIKPTAKQEGREAQEATDMDTVGGKGTIGCAQHRKETHSYKFFRGILLYHVHQTQQPHQITSSTTAMYVKCNSLEETD